MQNLTKRFPKVAVLIQGLAIDIFNHLDAGEPKEPSLPAEEQKGRDTHDIDADGFRPSQAQLERVQHDISRISSGGRTYLSVRRSMVPARRKWRSHHAPHSTSRRIFREPFDSAKLSSMSDSRFPLNTATEVKRTGAYCASES